MFWGLRSNFDKNVGGILANYPYTFVYISKRSLLILIKIALYRDIAIHIVSTKKNFEYPRPISSGIGYFVGAIEVKAA